jgi:hypothetical protein
MTLRRLLFGKRIGTFAKHIGWPQRSKTFCAPAPDPSPQSYNAQVERRYRLIFQKGYYRRRMELFAAIKKF